jgi:hypothetical protein
MWSKKSLLRKHRSAPLRLDHPNGFTKLQTASLSSNEVGGFFFGIREQIFFGSVEVEEGQVNLIAGWRYLPFAYR